VGVQHRRTDVLVSEQFLDRANIVPIFEQVRREGVAQGMAARVLGEPGFATGFFDRFLEDGFMEMVPP